MTNTELRQQAAISVLNSLLETTQHSVIEVVGLRDIYANVAVMYADSLVSALSNTPDSVERFLDKIDWKGVLKI